MKKLFLTLIMVITTAFIMQSAIPAFAQNYGGQGLIHDVNNWQNQASKAAQRQQNGLQHVIQVADTLITNRLSSLNALTTRIQNDTRLSANEKSSITSDIQTDISELTVLKAKIDADTDVTIVRSDEKKIITNYYIYAMFEPKMRLLIVLNDLQTVAANLQALVPQIQNLINTFQSQGKSVSQIQTLLADVSSQLQTINTTLTNDTTTIQNVNVATQNKSATFTQVHQDIAQIIHAGFAKIQSDFAKMRSLFHQLIFPSSLVTTTPTVTCTPRPSCLDTHPACELAEPASGWCPTTANQIPSPTNSAQ